MSSHYLQIRFKICNITTKMSGLPFKAHSQLLVFLAVFASASLPPWMSGSPEQDSAKAASLLGAMSGLSHRRGALPV